MAQSTNSDRQYRLNLVDSYEDIFQFEASVERTPETDQLALDFMNAKLALLQALWPEQSRYFTRFSLDYTDTTTTTDFERDTLHKVDNGSIFG
ncbi:hypothetical protein AB0K74_16325 [Streptomyces sp. NPDC056159]|uniref:hypothetical protein n=1 Tax=Streptomyces sp. NPDC056159 TaxID=3155537 RepID=UPI003422172A